MVRGEKHVLFLSCMAAGFGCFGFMVFLYVCIRVVAVHTQTLKNTSATVTNQSCVTRQNMEQKSEVILSRRIFH